MRSCSLSSTEWTVFETYIHGFITKRIDCFGVVSYGLIGGIDGEISIPVIGIQFYDTAVTRNL